MENCTKCNLAHPKRIACSLAIEAAKAADALVAPAAAESTPLSAAERSRQRMKQYWADKKAAKAAA